MKIKNFLHGKFRENTLKTITPLLLPTNRET